jgi:hypothetical protein
LPTGIRLETRFCIECENFEDRGEIDGAVVCAKAHRPKIACADFKDKFGDMRKVKLKTRSCGECENFEDRREIDGAVLCAKGHRPGISCEDFKDRLVDIFYLYIYWACLYKTGGTNAGTESFESRYSRKLSGQELAYACLLDYFELGLDDSHFHRCWNVVKKNYGEKLSIISKIFDAALQRLNSHGERTDLKKVFVDLLSFKKPEETIEKILKGDYRHGAFVSSSQRVLP